MHVYVYKVSSIIVVCVISLLSVIIGIIAKKYLHHDQKKDSARSPQVLFLLGCPCRILLDRLCDFSFAYDCQTSPISGPRRQRQRYIFARCVSIESFRIVSSLNIVLQVSLTAEAVSVDPISRTIVMNWYPELISLDCISNISRVYDVYIQR